MGVSAIFVSTLAQTRPSSPVLDRRSSAKEGNAGSSKQIERTPSPEDEPALRHSTFYIQDELVILRVSTHYDCIESLCGPLTCATVE